MTYEDVIKIKTWVEENIFPKYDTAEKKHPAINLIRAVSMLHSSLEWALNELKNKEE